MNKRIWSEWKIKKKITTEENLKQIGVQFIFKWCNNNGTKRFVRLMFFHTCITNYIISFKLVLKFVLVSYASVCFFFTRSSSSSLSSLCPVRFTFYYFIWSSFIALTEHRDSDAASALDENISNLYLSLSPSQEFYLGAFPWFFFIDLISYYFHFGRNVLNCQTILNKFWLLL